MYETAASIGPVLEIDMDIITLEMVKAKVGVRDIDKIPHYAEITAKDLMIYRVTVKLESVIEHGWYTEYKRHNLEEVGQGEMRKK